MQIRGVVRVAMALLLLAGCTSAPPTTVPTGAASPSAAATGDLVEGDHLNPDAMAALRDQFAALSPAEQDQELAAQDLAIERQLWRLSGLEARLGGAQRADAAFARSNTLIRAQLADVGSAVTGEVKIGRKGIALPFDALSDASGAALFGALTLAKLNSPAAADLVTGKDYPRVTKDGITRSATPTTGSLQVTSNGVSDGVDVTIHIDTTVQACPDTSGQLVTSITASAATNLAGTGTRVSYHDEVTIQVGDDAQTIGRTEAFRTEKSEYSPKGRRFVAIASRPGSTTVERVVGDVTDDFATSTAKEGVEWGQLLGEIAVEAAEAKWLSGDCVTLNPTLSAGPSGLEPGATVTIVAAPRARSDGAPTGGTVTAQLTGGGTSVAPAGAKVPADATFTYVAPNSAHKTGTVALESRSRRGVGKASVTFATEQLSFSADGGANEFHGTGTICDLNQPFVIAGSGLKLSFTPSSASGGSYKLSGNAGGVAWSGGGSYTVAVNEGGTSGKLVAKGVNTISTPRGTFSDSVVAKFTLRSIASCGG